MYEIKQKKFGIFTRNAIIDPVKKIITFKISNSFNIFSKTSLDISFFNIDIEEIKTRSFDFKYFAVSMFMIIVAVFGASEVYKDYYMFHKPLLHPDLCGGYIIISLFWSLGILGFLTTIVNSSEQARFKKLSDGTLCFLLFSSGKYKMEYQQFKEKLDQEVKNVIEQRTLTNLIKQIDTEVLVDAFRDV